MGLLASILGLSRSHAWSNSDTASRGGATDSREQPRVMTWGNRTQCFIVALYYDTTMPDYPWPSNIPLTERNQAIIEAYQRGETLEGIAATFEISIARVHQILKNRG